MRQVILLALANAGSLLVQLLAVVLVILTRPRPRPLLWAFWLAAMVVSCGVSAIVLAVFRAKGTILGSTTTSVSPTLYLVLGVIALAVAIFAATKRGRELIGREIERKQSAEPSEKDSAGNRASAKVAEVRSKTEDALKQGSVWVAILVGVFLGAPSPFSLAAVGHMVRDGYGLITQLLLILVFALITYLVVEIPIISYAIAPEGTAARVEAFSTWLGAHKIQAVAAVVAVIGVVLIIKGLTSL
jgi:hypothetical protein